MDFSKPGIAKTINICYFHFINEKMQQVKLRDFQTFESRKIFLYFGIGKCR